MKSKFTYIEKRVVKYKIQIQNFGYLAAINIFNLLVPLITYPYLIRVLGVNTYGLVIFAQVVVTYLQLLVSFGFTVTATKEVSIHRNNNEKLTEIVSSVYMIKGILFVLSIILLSSVLLFIPDTNIIEELFYLSMWICLYEVVFPIWFFQGIEKMKYITYITLFGRLFFIGFIFLLINSPEDFLFVPIINGVGGLISGFISLFIVFGTHKIKFKLQPISILKYYFKESISIFISELAIRLYINTNKILAGVFLSMAEVAYLDLAEKITALLKMPIQIIGQTLYPKLSIEKNLKFLKNTFYSTLIFALFLLLFGIAFSKVIVLFLGGSEMSNSLSILRILMISIIPVTISMFYGNLTLLPKGFNKDYLKIRIYTLLVYFISVIVLFYLNSLNLIMLVTILVYIEFFAAIFSFYIAKKKGLNFLGINKNLN